MRMRGGAASAALLAVTAWAVSGCGLLGDDVSLPTSTAHALPEVPAGISDAWIPADYFVVSTVLAVSESGDVLVAFADGPGAWADGISSFGIATVTPDGTVDRLVEPGSVQTTEHMPLGGALSETSAVIYVDGATPQSYGRYLLIDRRTRESRLSGETFDGPDGVVEDMGPSIEFVLIGDTVVWTQTTEAGVGNLVSLSLADGARTHSADDPVFDYALNDVLSLGRDYCAERSFWIYGYELGGDGPFIAASATLSEDGVVSVDEGSFVPAAEFSRAPFVARCGESVLGSLGGQPVDGRVPLLLATPENAAGVPVGAAADDLDSMAITRDWLVLGEGDPVSSGHSLVTLVNRRDDNRTTIEADGWCAILSPMVAGSTIAWATGAVEVTDLKKPLRAACTVAVGTLASP